MPADLALVRRLALALPEVTEGLCFGTPTFYLGKKLMLRLWEDGETLVVKFPLAQREDRIEEDPDVFSVTDHYRTYPAILVNLHAVNPTVLAELIDGAWRMVATNRQAKAREQGSAIVRPPVSRLRK